MSSAADKRCRSIILHPAGFKIFLLKISNYYRACVYANERHCFDTHFHLRPFTSRMQGKSFFYETRLT